MALLFAGLFLSLVDPIPAVHAATKGNPKYASIVIDAETGVVLHERYADKALHPASLTKVMTLLMVFEAIEQGRIDLNDRIRISNHAAGMSPSKLGLAPGSSIKVKDAIYALVTKSANDIAAAVAEHLGGTESNFARMMTQRARELGMSRTVFKNASGLHNPGQVSSARDMATLARVVIVSHPDYYRYFSTKNFTYGNQSFHNHNRLMNSYQGMDGMKTGYIQPSGFNLVASAVRNNQRLIGVVFGGRTAQSRNDHMASLLNTGFAQVNEIRIAHAKVPLPPHKPGILTALNAINTAGSTNQGQGPVVQKLAFNESKFAEGQFSELLGEGDYDPAATRRIETGLMAIAAIKGEGTLYQDAPATQLPVTEAAWAVQVGAFKSRAATDQALHKTIKTLPRQFADAQPAIAPLKTKDGWLFRARLGGLTKDEAFKACRYLNECMPIPAQ
jgi:D-alanyl-D-alanine carboxypeptidase